MERVKIYIVEDELIHLEAAKICVWECGYEIVGNTDSPNEAIRQIVQNKPDVVLIDISLNGKKRGIELAKKIIEEFQITVIYTTCHADNKTMEKAIEAEPASYIVKPVTTSNLKAAVMLALKKKKEISPEKNIKSVILERLIEKSVVNSELNNECKDFLNMLICLVLSKITKTSFDFDQLASEIGISRTGLYRRIEELTDMSTGKLVRLIRLEKAALFFEDGLCSVSQCAYKTGFENLSYFTKCFSEHFGVVPSDYITIKK